MSYFIRSYDIDIRDDVRVELPDGATIVGLRPAPTGPGKKEGLQILAYGDDSTTKKLRCFILAMVDKYEIAGAAEVRILGTAFLKKANREYVLLEIV